MPRLKLIEMDSLNKMIYFRKDDKLIALDADVAIELISAILDGKYALVRHGHWEVIDEAEPRRYGCSNCKRLSFTEDNYCSYCGAKMDEVGEDD